jgi:hypothetical protein
MLWTAFYNIYSTIAAREGFSTQLIVKEDGTIETYANGSVNIPKVKIVSEREQIALALENFDHQLKHHLILHESTIFFLNRTPFWKGKQIEHDASGQRVNGVINVIYTSSLDYPVWSPIDHQSYETYLEEPDNESAMNFLTKQIVDLLYTVSKNLMRIGKHFDDGNDISVVENGLPLLELIVASYTQ